MKKALLYDFISRHKYAVISTVSPDHLPESAVVGFAVTKDLEIIFDTTNDTRKYQNLLGNPAVSIVIGWDEEQTVQYEGSAFAPTELELKDLLPVYFEVFPDGIERKKNWPNLAYVCVSPKWIRYSDFRNGEARIEEVLF